jgi:2-keto-4-pentenoate hydratase
VGLPTAGVAEHAGTALVARDGERVVGSAILEEYGTSALLRSVAVAPSWRRAGLGRRLTLAAVDLARAAGVETAYLLTETAERFFGTLGFYALPRAAVPEAVRTSVQFTSSCPATACAMRSLTTDGRVLRGTRTQLDRWRADLAAGANRVGWKIGFNDPAVPRHLGLGGSVVGHLAPTGVVAPGATHSLRGGTRVVVEPEVAIALAADVSAGAAHATAQAAIAGLGPALEIVDLAGSFDDLERMIADNVFHRGVALGPTDPTWARRGLGGVGARLLHGGAVRESADIGAVLGDPADVVRLVADTLGAFGETLRAGDRIISGSLTRPVAVSLGDIVVADLGPLGAVEARFSR